MSINLKGEKTESFSKATHKVQNYSLKRFGFWMMAIISKSMNKLEYVYTRPDPFGHGMKLVWISLVFTRDLADPL